jgi:hypothetical protein
MKRLLSTTMMLLLLVAMYPRVAEVAPVEWLGRITANGGAESESWRRKQSEAGAEAHGFGYLEGMLVFPIFGPLGLQGNLSWDGANGHRFDGSLGPVFDWGGGKIGVFVHRQYRLVPTARNLDHEFARVRNWWITPAASFYDLIPGTNIDIWHRQPLTLEYEAMSLESSDGFRNKRMIPYSQTRAAVNFFPGFLPFLAPGNLELTLGVQLNGLSGPGHENVALGVGPVFGAAFMPVAGLPLEVTLFRAVIDNHNRYRVNSGLQFYFSKGNETLLQLRRKYLEPTNLPAGVSTFAI